MASQTLLVSSATIQTMKKHYQNNLQSPVPYSEFRAKIGSCVITAYTSGKVLFQGNQIEEQVALWTNQTKTTPDKKTTKVSKPIPKLNHLHLIGSDEVGNGSYFGALCVCAAFVEPLHYDLLTEYGVKDSKLLTDIQIREIAWKLKETIPYELTTCWPLKYNQVNQTKNANEIKAILHNFTIHKLLSKLPNLDNLDGILIDQFTPENNYFKYIKNEPQSYNGQYHIYQKAESLHLSVACASIIARDAFLDSLEQLGKPYGQVLKSGAGAPVDQQGVQLVKRFGKQALQETAKLHFANTQKILNKV